MTHPVSGSKRRKHNPERRTWRGKSYKKSGHGGPREAPSVRGLRERLTVSLNPQDYPKEDDGNGNQNTEN